MKTKIFAPVLALFVALLVACFANAQEFAQINYFEFETYQKQNGMYVLSADFYIYEDMSEYIGTGSIEYNCSTGELSIDEIVDVPEEIVVNGTAYSEEQLIGGIAYILSEIILYLETGDGETIFPEHRPDSLYNDNHPSSAENWLIIDNYVPGDCPQQFFTFLPNIVTN